MQIVWAIVSVVAAAALLVGLPAVLVSEGKAGQWRRAAKWTAIGTGVYIVVAFGWVILSYTAGEPEYDPPPNVVVNWTERRVDVYRFDQQGVIQAVGFVRGRGGGNGFDGLCDSSRFVAYEEVGKPMPSTQTPIEASWLEDRAEIARTTQQVCDGEYWIIVEGGSRVITAQQADHERYSGPFVRNLLDGDIDLFAFGWDDPGVLTWIGWVGSDFRRRMPELVSPGEECVDLGLVAFAASGEAILNPNVEYQIGELGDRSELGRTTEPLCLYEYWLIDEDGSRVVPESEYER